MFVQSMRCAPLVVAMILVTGQAGAQTISAAAEDWQDAAAVRSGQAVQGLLSQPAAVPSDSTYTGPGHTGAASSQFASPSSGRPVAAEVATGSQALSPIDRLRQAPDPAAAISLYAEMARDASDGVEAESALVQRMVEFGMPALAEQQARKILEVDPNDGVAWAVLADAAGRRGETALALTHAATAARAAPDDPFVQDTAGKLVAWLDGHAAPDDVTADMQSAAGFIRNAMVGREAYLAAYDQASEFYREQERLQRTDAQEMPPPEVAREQREVYAEQPQAQTQTQMPYAEAPQPLQAEQPVYQSYTYNTYYSSPQYGTYAAAPYAYGYGTPYYGYTDPSWSYGAGYGYVAPAFYYGGYRWPCFSTFIVAPSFWPRQHTFRHGFLGHHYYPRYYTTYGKRFGAFGFAGSGGRFGAFGFTAPRYGHRDGYSWGRSAGVTRGSVDRFASPSIPRSVARDWTHGGTASPSIPRTTVDRGVVGGRADSGAVTVPRGTVDRGSAVGRTGTASASVPRASFDRGTAISRPGTGSPSSPRGTVDRGGATLGARGTASAIIPRSSVTTTPRSAAIPRASVGTAPRGVRSDTFGFVAPSTPRSPAVARPPVSSLSTARAPQAVTRSVTPRVPATPRVAPGVRSVPGRSAGVSIPRASGSAPRVGASRGISVPGSSGISRGASIPRSGGISRGMAGPSRSVSAAPRMSAGRGAGPAISRGNASRSTPGRR